MKTGAFLVCVCLLTAVPSYAADTPKVDLAAGYMYAHDKDRDQNFNAGWFVTIAGNVNSWFGVVAELGAGYLTCSACPLSKGPYTANSLAGTDLHIKMYTYSGGPRVASHAIPRLTPFAQFLVGGNHLSGGYEWIGALTTATGLQPGGGIDISVSPKWGVRVQGDYRLIHVGHGAFSTPIAPHWAKQTRFIVGVVWKSSPL